MNHVLVAGTNRFSPELVITQGFSQLGGTIHLDMTDVTKIINEVKSKMCTGKKSYESKGAAEFFADTYMQRPYQCPYCNKWHLSTKEVPNYRYNGDSK